MAVDVFEQLNKLNLLMKSRHTNIVKFVDALKLFLCKLRIWSKKIFDGNYSMFESISMMSKMGNKQMPELLQENIIFYPTALEEFKHYFPEVRGEELNLVRNPFKCSVDSISDEQQNQFIDLQKDFTAKDLLDDNTVKEFWIYMIGSYSNVAKVALHSLLPFDLTYLCEPGFSTMLLIKTVHRNRLELTDDIGCALSETSPRRNKLLKNKQCQTFY